MLEDVSWLVAVAGRRSNVVTKARVVVVVKPQLIREMVRKRSTRNDVCSQISMIFMIFREESDSRREDCRR